MKLPGVLKTAVRLAQKKHQIKSRLTMPYTETRGDAKLYILKSTPSGAKPFKILAIIPEFGVGRFNEYRNRTPFEVATTDLFPHTIGEVTTQKTFGELLGIATHVATDFDGVVYSIKDGDETQVRQTDFTYSILGWQTSDRFNAADYE